MRKWLRMLLLAGCLGWGVSGVALAQQKEAEPPPREAPPVLIPYALAGIGVVVVMVLVCMPARRD